MYMVVNNYYQTGSFNQKIYIMSNDREILEEIIKRIGNKYKVVSNDE